MYKKLLWAFGALFVLCCGCQREIDLELPDYQPKLVIEGTIENGAPAMVMLSKSIPYFSEITLEMLMNDVLKVRDGCQVHHGVFLLKKICIQQKSRVLLRAQRDAFRGEGVLQIFEWIK